VGRKGGEGLDSGGASSPISDYNGSFAECGVWKKRGRKKGTPFGQGLLRGGRGRSNQAKWMKSSNRAGGKQEAQVVARSIEKVNAYGQILMNVDKKRAKATDTDAQIHKQGKDRRRGGPLALEHKLKD